MKFKEEYAAGKKLRSKIPRGSHALWKAPAKRPSVVKMIQLSDYDRLPNLVPIRHFRMSKSPFVFIVQRQPSWLLTFHTPSSGITVQACGDCHLTNFGGYATPERTLVADINDFDETNPGPWEWDVKRLAASFMLACRSKNFVNGVSRDILTELIAAYREKVNEYAQMNFLELWYTKFTIDDIAHLSSSKKLKDAVSNILQKVSSQSHEKVFYKITSGSLQQLAIRGQPPLIYHPINVKAERDMINKFMETYKNTLSPDRKMLLDQYKVVDVALKVVGVGSVGTRCLIVLMMNGRDEPIFVQVKEARPSVLEAYTEKSIYVHQGERIVQGQRIIQAASDIFLGWSVGPGGRHFYLRQLKDKKISFDVDSYKKFAMILYARLCGTILARAHCKTAKGAFIAGYMGQGEKFLEAINKFAGAYADQTEKDYNEFMKAVKAGKLRIKEELTS